MPFRTEERIGEALRINVVVGANCDGCDVELQGVEGRVTELTTTFVAKGAMSLLLGGGYGMFFDDMPVRAVLCRKCSRKLLEVFPGIAKAMKEQERW